MAWVFSVVTALALAGLVYGIAYCFIHGWDWRRLQLVAIMAGATLIPAIFAAAFWFDLTDDPGVQSGRNLLTT